jgi:hypothetical protein
VTKLDSEAPMPDSTEIVSDPTDRPPKPKAVGGKGPKAKPKSAKAKPGFPPHAPTPPGLGVAYTSPEAFASAMAAAQVAGTIPPFPLPPAPIPGDWFTKIAIWLRSLTPLGPITIAR